MQKEDSIERQLTELGLQLTTVKRKIALCDEQAETASDEDKAELQKQREVLVNQEIGLLDEMKRLREIRRPDKGTSTR